MSSSKISFPTIFLVSSILVLISTSISPVQCRSPSSPNYSMLQTACSNTNDVPLCLRVLQSIPKIVSAKNLPSLSIAIIESGISNATNARAHIEAAFNRTGTAARVKGALNECKVVYDEVINRFTQALHEVEIYEYLYPSYELLTASTDYVKLCAAAVADQNVEDDVVSRGNTVVPIFGLSACSIVDQLNNLQPSSAPPPPPRA